MKKINLLGSYFQYRKIETNALKILVVVLVVFLAYNAYVIQALRQEAQKIPPIHQTEEKIAKLEASIKELEEDIELQKEYLQELKRKAFPYQEIVEFFAKRTPKNMMILAVFDQEDIIVARGIAMESRALSELVERMEAGLEVEEIKITELFNRDNGQLFEIQVKRKVDMSDQANS